MSTMNRDLQRHQSLIAPPSSRCHLRSFRLLGFLILCLIALGSGGCGQTAQPVISAATDQVHSYFGGPFLTGSTVGTKASTAFDHSANTISVSGLLTEKVPVNLIGGSIASTDTGFLRIAEGFATTTTAVLTPFNPPLTGAWAVEIPGAGALANLLSVNTNSAPATISAAPNAMVDASACPSFSTVPFLYVTVPNLNPSSDLADYGTVQISAQGSAVTFKAQPYLVGPQQQPSSTVTGGCS